ncbi:hypothetical protein M5D96_000802 [Drosophila gunungcola]|uniref:Peptidylprolyl isomerase n=1 Tax=Drosophila gunungcola TaxID=103775 RepID=A0A9Q0BUG1_9MUSC|nr:hypothetical protein M5D96_000802 [Drosophila gunungcola]
METSIQVPKELESLLSCGLCNRVYDLATNVLPRELICRHSYCEECLARSTLCDPTQCICPLCGIRTELYGQKLPESLPALVLGRAMLDFSEGNSRSIEVAGEQPESQSENWLDEICVDSFLATSAEHCFIHAMPNSTWCHDCQHAPTHREHRLTHQLDYHELLRQLLDSELAKIKGTALQATELANREMDLLRQMCEACFHVQLHVKRMMLEHEPSIISATMTANLLQVLAQLAQQRRKFEVQLVEVHFQCRMRAAVQENGMQILDFEHLNDRILRLRNQPRPGPIPANVEPPQALILTNYCMIPPRVRTPPSEPELLPQSGRAVVPPHFNHSLQEAELSQQMQQVEQDQDRLINLAAEEDSPGSSYSQSSSNSDSQSSLSAGPQDQMWQGPYEVQEQPPPLLQHQFQADNAWLNGQQNQNHNHVQSPPVGIVGQPSAHFYPIYFLDMEIAGELAGRVLIEVRSDVAPRMAENFRALVRHERGYGYQGCAVFQAWGRESIITGDFETHNGRGGHSAFENRYFMPDETGLPARRGTVGMRRGQRRQDRSGLVGSQFRLVLNEMRSFTAIFGYIVQGIELVDRIAASGNALGRPSLRSIIRNCGEYQLNN